MRLLSLLVLLPVCLTQAASGYRRNNIYLECGKMGGACKHQKTQGCSILPAECKSRHKHCCRL
ncbi:beta-defensin 33-like [Heterocephalus glaber]|uniref:Beta-defensin 33-like n=1 Tax=Heterocephalus glaber TaxID=10181 RepID=A0AAX6QKL2_HETGA|nr:beta-defensin 33-like [Heterocephalus glaber]XP_004875489.1 beta-defensin 33-like [Heterocephalus glaber]XP_004875490.1 beta-defensin 33-like [Heterocephalus glaber]